MSGVLEQTAEELDFLVGATITNVRVKTESPELEGYGFDSIELTAKLKAPIEDQHGTKSDIVRLEVWQDPEANGPGVLALTEVVKRSPRQPKTRS
jgi:hypothetical protein